MGRAAAGAWTARLRRMLARSRGWARRHLPPGARLLAGLVLIVGGLFGFLPVLGFWMIPLGLAIALLDIAPLWRWLRGRTRERDDGEGRRR